MTIRQAYEYALIEVNKLKAPAILLEDYLYLFNKAIQQYVNGVYNRCDYNQQSTDDLSSLQTVVVLEYDHSKEAVSQFNDTIWTLSLPDNYLHILNCISEFSVGASSNVKCGTGTKSVTSPCQRLTADLYPGILNNFYMKPSYKKPYYYIVTEFSESEAESETESNSSETGVYNLFETDSDNAYNKQINIDIHSGSSKCTLSKIYVTYIRTPNVVTMSQEDILNLEDTTEVLEFPEYVCYEIINTYVRLVMENAGNPRLQTNIPINQTIAEPGKQQ